MTDNDNQPGPFQYGPPPGAPAAAPPPPAVKPRRRWVWPTVAGAALLVGITIGSGGDDPEPAAGQTGETVTVTETRVPDECLDALDSAEELMDISADFASVAAEFPPMIAEGIEAGMAYDVAAVEDLTGRIEASTGDIERLTGQVEGSSYGDDAAGCRDAAGE